MVKPRERRIPIMFSDDELAAIDDWRFGNRIATRADAVRRLCQIALFVDENLEEITDLAIDGVGVLTQRRAEGIEAGKIIRDRKLYMRENETEDLLDMISEHDNNALHGVTSIKDMLLTMYNGVAELVNARSYKGGQRELKRVVADYSARTEEIDASAKAREKSHYLPIMHSPGAADRRAEFNALSDELRDEYLEKWIADLGEEEAADATAFAKRYGMRPRFWVTGRKIEE